MSLLNKKLRFYFKKFFIIVKINNLNISSECKYLNEKHCNY